MIGILLVLLTAAAVFTGITIATKGSILGDLGLIRTRTQAFSVTFLKEIRELYTFNTVEYIYKTVFPHDYLPGGENQIQSIRRLQARQNSAKDDLTDTERQFLEAYTLSRNIGIDPWSNEFVVLTVIVTGGFDLSNTVFENPETASPEELSEYFTITEEREDTRTLKTIHLKLPQPEITDIIIEDIDPTKYLYPDIKIDAREWKQLALFTRERIAEKVIREGILERAETNGEQFLRIFLNQAGYDRIFFQSGMKTDD
jgi:hypothetical protein